MQKRLQVLVAAMNQNDLSLAERMNAKCDVIIANQGQKEGIVHEEINHCAIKMISSQTHGVGLNRNLALEFATGDILLFADDDVQYDNGMAERVLQAFEELPQADMIVFGMRFSKEGKIFYTRCPETRKIGIRYGIKSGTCSIAIRREVVRKYHLNFTELFGGGCIYSHGEDSDFLLQCFHRKVKVYSYRFILGTTTKDVSSCFEGYNEKYFFDVGALARHSFGILAFPYMLYMMQRRLETTLNWKEKYRYLKAGYCSFPKLFSYVDWKNELTRI